MFAKLLVIILAIGGTACALLVLRQQRVEMSHEVALTHNRLLQHERVIWDLRSDIAALCRPGDVRKLVDASHDDWTPIPAVPERIDVPAISEDPLLPGVFVTETYPQQPRRDPRNNSTQ